VGSCGAAVATVLTDRTNLRVKCVPVVMAASSQRPRTQIARPSIASLAICPGGLRRRWHTPLIQTIESAGARRARSAHQARMHQNSVRGANPLSNTEAETSGWHMFMPASGLDVHDGDVLAALGSVLLQKQRPQDAVAMFSKAAGLQPGSVEHEHNAAVAHLAAGETDRALERLQQAVTLDPYYERSWLLMVQIYRQTGRPELGRKTMERYLKHVPQSLTFRTALNKSVSR
jgi:tetratricopeptide (TPR) repeat protein